MIRAQVASIARSSELSRLHLLWLQLLTLFLLHKSYISAMLVLGGKLATKDPLPRLTSLLMQRLLWERKSLAAVPSSSTTLVSLSVE